MEKKLEPHWGGAVSTIAFLYAFWAAAAFYNTALKGPGYHEGPGVLGIYILIPVVFTIVLFITIFPFGWALILVKDNFARLGIILTALIIFLVGYGIPSLITTGVAILFFYTGYTTGKKARKDAADLKDFMEDKDAR